MYRRSTYTFPDAREVEEYASLRYGAPGQKRAERRKATPEQMAAANQRAKEKKCRRKLRAHFKKDDYFVTLTYRKDERPQDMEAAKQDVRRFIRRIRKAYKGRGDPLKWIANIECGSRGAWHVHLAINRTQDGDRIISKAWEHGRIMMQLIYEQGKCQRLAAYLTKTPLTDKRLKESHYMASRNLPIPKPKQKIIRWKPFGKIRTPEGWYLDKESYIEGINPVTGYLFREYAYLRSRRD